MLLDWGSLTDLPQVVISLDDIGVTLSTICATIQTLTSLSQLLKGRGSLLRRQVSIANDMSVLFSIDRLLCDLLELYSAVLRRDRGLLRDMSDVVRALRRRCILVLVVFKRLARTWQRRLHHNVADGQLVVVLAAALATIRGADRASRRRHLAVDVNKLRLHEIRTLHIEEVFGLNRQCHFSNGLGLIRKHFPALQNVHQPTVDLLSLLLPLLRFSDCLLKLIDLLLVQRLLLVELVPLQPRILLQLRDRGTHRRHLLGLRVNDRLEETAGGLKDLPMLPRAPGARLADQPMADGFPIQWTGGLPELGPLLMLKVINNELARNQLLFWRPYGAGLRIRWQLLFLLDWRVIGHPRVDLDLLLNHLLDLFHDVRWWLDERRRRIEAMKVVIRF